MAHDVFVSHSVKDKGVAEAVVTRLEADSTTCWIAPRDVVPGADWGESIIDAIESSRIMILIFSRNADASPQIKREVERAVNKGVYIIPFRVDDIPPTKSLEYFISTSQWMDAFSPPLERHLDNLAKTIQAVLKRPPRPAANVPTQPEKPSIAQPPIRPSGRKSVLIAIIIAALVIVGGAGWYLVQKKKGPSEKPVVTPTSVPITPAAVAPVPTFAPTPVPTLTPTSPTPFPTPTRPPPSPPSATMINDEEVRNFVTTFYRAEERGDVDYMLSQYVDSFTWGKERHDKAFHRNELNEFLKRWPVNSFTIGDIRVEHSDVPDRVTAYFEVRFFNRDPASGRSDSGHVSQEWVISKTSGALKIASTRGTTQHDSPKPIESVARPGTSASSSTNVTGDAKAEYDLAVKYEKGIGVPKDIGKAFELYEKSAASGYAPAQFNLGVCYELGNGVPKDVRRAVTLYRQAANQGNSDAICKLGILSEYGIGVPKDSSKAIELYRKAAAKGNAYGQMKLGNGYEFGVGVPKDISKAIDCYRKAADMGNTEAKWRMERLRAMNP